MQADSDHLVEVRGIPGIGMRHLRQWDAVEVAAGILAVVGVDGGA
jgi:hypothetical protein